MPCSPTPATMLSSVYPSELQAQTLGLLLGGPVEQEIPRFPNLGSTGGSLHSPSPFSAWLTGRGLVTSGVSPLSAVASVSPWPLDWPTQEMGGGLATRGLPTHPRFSARALGQ